MCMEHGVGFFDVEDEERVLDQESACLWAMRYQNQGNVKRSRLFGMDD